MKYIGIVRIELPDLDDYTWTPLTNFSMYKSDAFDSKKEALDWLNEYGRKVEIMYSHFRCQKEITKSILAIDEVESENYEAILDKIAK